MVVVGTETYDTTRRCMLGYVIIYPRAYASVLQPRPDTSGVVVAGSSDGPVSVGAVVVNRLPVPCTANVTVEVNS